MARSGVLVLLVLSLAACSQRMTATSATQTAGGGLEGTAWNAIEVSGTTVTVDATAADRRPHLVFATEGRVSGSDRP